MIISTSAMIGISTKAVHHRPFSEKVLSPQTQYCIAPNNKTGVMIQILPAGASPVEAVCLCVSDSVPVPESRVRQEYGKKCIV